VTERPTLLVLIDKMGLYGGERVAQTLIEELSASADIVLVTFAPDDSTASWRPGGSVRRVRIQPPRGRVRAFVAVVRGVRQVIRTESPDAALSFMAMANVLLGFASVGTGCRTVMSEHTIVSLASPVASRWSKAFSMVRRLAYRRADVIVCVSADVAQDLIEHRWAGPDRTVVIHNPIDVEAISRLARDTADVQRWRAGRGNAVLVLLVGSLRPMKGHITALRAVQQLPARYELVFVGDGELREGLHAEAQSLDVLDRVTFRGALDNPYGWMAEADVVIVPSTYEGFGLVVAEARSLDTRVVASDVLGLREVVGLVGGSLVAAGDATSLAAAIVEALVSQGRQACSELSSLAPASVARRYREALALP
jgi:glycosyltransferase involved in cell wall biosynthesis